MPTNRIPGDKRNTRAWRYLVRRVVQEEPWCWLAYPGVCTRRSQTADHVLPVKTHPQLSLERANVHGACHACNNHRKHRPPPPHARVGAGRTAPPPTPRQGRTRDTRQSSGPRRGDALRFFDS